MNVPQGSSVGQPSPGSASRSPVGTPLATDYVWVGDAYGFARPVLLSSDAVTIVSVVTANGISGTVANPTTTPAITLQLGAITPTSVNGNILTTGTGTLTLSSYTLTVSSNASISGTNTGDQTSVSGNAGTATVLQTSRTINGVSFNGSTNITVTAAAGTLTGNTLNATVLTSSLTSVGVIGTGTWQGTVVGTAYGGTGLNCSSAGNGKLLIGNGSGFTLANIASADSSVNITNTSGGIDLSVNGPVIRTGADLVGQNSAVTVATYTGSVGTYRVGVYLTITSITLDVIQIQVSWTDETSTVRTSTFFPMGLTSANLSTVGAFSFPVTDIRVKSATAITVSTTLITGTGSIVYDAGSTIEQLR